MLVTVNPALADEGVSKNERLNLLVFPNPANDVLNVQTRFHETLNKDIYENGTFSPTAPTLELKDVFGRVVYRFEGILRNNQAHSINVLRLAPGQYFLKIAGNGFSEVRKVWVVE